jgi:hypothetical protein
MPSRRTFIKAGLLGGIALGAGGVWYAATRERAPAGRLPAVTRAMFAAITPVILAGSLDEGSGPVERLVDGVERAVAGLSAAAQAELGDLFGLLGFYPARKLLTGIGDWRLATRAEVEGFLSGWRLHRVALMQGAYAALHDLVLGAWYAQPDSWEAIGYPGPPEVK